MIRRPPRSTRTDTLFPYTTLFRSAITTISRAGCPSAGKNTPKRAIGGPVPKTWMVRAWKGGRYFDLFKDNSVRSEEHTSELQSLMRISYAVFCLKKKNNLNKNHNQNTR